MVGRDRQTGMSIFANIFKVDRRSRDDEPFLASAFACQTTSIGLS
jgi:hypothetical protein